ncbi:MAG: 5'/3'-nucleotidase SurE [Bacillota bacterium]|nr:5'/3'-nucleotidase SurE [Bacillota bacterium]
MPPACRKRPIVLTNDDGIASPGLLAMSRAFAGVYGDRVWVVAPAGERSAVGHGITLHGPVEVCRLTGLHPDPVEAYAVSGTPADCIKLAVQQLAGLPALVCSGINNGANLGTDVFYSGTVSAAIEAAILGLPALAVSRERGGDEDYDYAAAIALRLGQMIMRRGVPRNTLLNVNVPAAAGPADGDGRPNLRITRLGTRRYRNDYRLHSGDGHTRCYVLAGEQLDLEDEHGTDVAALGRGDISVTPVHLDLTNHAVLASMEEWLR